MNTIVEMLRQNDFRLCKERILLACLMLINVALLGLSNSLTKKLQMYDRIVEVVGDPKPYARRLHLVDELIKSSGRDDWAIAMGMINPSSNYNGPRRTTL